MKTAIELLEHIKKALRAYDQFTENVSEVDHEVYKKAQGEGSKTLLSDVYDKGLDAETAAERLHGYLIAVQETGYDKTVV